MSRVYRVRETYLCGEYLNEGWRTRNSRLWERSQDFDFVVKNSYRPVHNPVQAGRHLPAGHTQIRFLSMESRNKAIEYIEGFSNFSVPHATTGRWFPSTNRSRRCPNRKSLWVGALQTCWHGKHIQPWSIIVQQHPVKMITRNSETEPIYPTVLSPSDPRWTSVRWSLLAGSVHKIQNLKKTRRFLDKMNIFKVKNGKITK